MPSELPFQSFLVSLLTAFFILVKGPKFECLDKEYVVLLVVDHQVGLFQMTHDMQPDLLAHAAIGKVFNLPTILTTSSETGWGLIHSL
jgi:hypothetical protein